MKLQVKLIQNMEKAAEHKVRHDSRNSICKMADDESKSNTSLSWLLAASCSLKALIKNSATLGNTRVEQCFDSQKDGNGFFSFVRR